MKTLRAFFRQHQTLAFGLVALALLLKAVLPTGYMVGAETRTFTVQICHDASGGASPLKLVLPVKSGEREIPGKPAQGECPYCALSMVCVGGTDAVLLALALAFILALGFAESAFPSAQRRDYLRPPLRGPPVLA